MKNVKIVSTRLIICGDEARGCASFWLYLEGAGSFGGYSLDDPGNDGRVGTAFGMDAIIGVCRAVGVCAWEDLAGCYARVDREDSPTVLTHITDDSLSINLSELAAAHRIN